MLVVRSVNNNIYKSSENKQNIQVNLSNPTARGCVRTEEFKIVVETLESSHLISCLDF